MNAALEFLSGNREMLEAVGAPDPGSLSVLTVTPRFRASSHVVFLVFGPAEEGPLLAMKICRDPAGGDTLEREAASLRHLSAAWPGGADSFPRVLALDRWEGAPILVETALAGRTMKPRLVRRRPGACARALMEWLEGKELATARPPADAAAAVVDRLVLEPLEELRVVLDPGPDEERCLDVVREHALLLRGREIPVVFEHGDLSAPNILLSPEGDLRVVDWELAAEEGLPGHDLFFALGYLAFARRRAERSRRYVDAFRDGFLGSSAWALPWVRRYAGRLGLDHDLLVPLFLCCWFRQLYRLADRLRGPAAVPLGAGPDAGLRDSRFFRLWKHAVEHVDELEFGGTP